MRRRSRALGWVFLGLLASAVIEACGESASESPPPGGAGVGGSGGLGPMDGTTVDAPSEGGDAGQGRPDYSPLCGIAGDGCVPDDARACSDYRAGSGGQSSGGTAGFGPGTGGSGAQSSGGFAGETAAAGESGAGGQGGQSGEGNGGEGPGVAEGGRPSAGTAGRGGTGGVPPDGGLPPDGGMTVYSCQVQSSSGEPAAACLEAGSGDVDDPCLGGADCRPGLACVGKVAGRCRPYCCDQGSCRTAGTQCSVEPLVSAGSLAGDEPPTVPVCVPAIECNLAEDYPCGDDRVCTCPEGTACLVVDNEGTTSCAPPGDGTEGEACPCAWNHVCSQATNQCVKLCQTAAATDDCGSGRCQASPALPLGWGICVGYAPADGG